MKRAFIFGEFIAKSTTGIAYVNTNLESVLKELNFFVETLDDPRSYDYLNYKDFIKKNYNIIKILKVILESFYILTLYILLHALALMN